MLLKEKLLQNHNKKLKKKKKLTAKEMLQYISLHALLKYQKASNKVKIVGSLLCERSVK